MVLASVDNTHIGEKKKKKTETTIMKIGQHSTIL